MKTTLEMPNELFRRAKATMRELKKISKRISAVWPEGVSAVDAIREQRRDL